jgi:hypothetical protein
MSSGIASLYKILKDETRKRIILLLNEKGTLTHTEMMEALGFSTTGLLNYHLKILGDLLTKNEGGQYSLSEKGKLAAKLLIEYPDTQLSGKPKWWRTFWIQTAIALPIMVASALALFFSGIIGLERLYQVLISIIFIIGFAYMLQHILRDILSKKKKLLIAKIGYTAGGVSLGLWVAYFGVGLSLAGISALLGNRFGPGNPLYHFFWSIWYQVFGVLVAPIIGAILMYRFGKKRRFKTYNYDPDS